MLFKGTLSWLETCLINLLVGRAYFYVLCEAHVYRAQPWQHSCRHVPMQMINPASTGQAINSGPRVPLGFVLPQGWQHTYKEGACKL